MIDFLLPSLGADMDSGMLVGWLVEPGDQVKSGQVIAEIETDKGIIEAECWHEGVVAELLRRPGPEKLPVGTPLARIRSSAESPSTQPEQEPEPPEAGETVTTPPPGPATTPTPPIRHLAHTLGVDLNGVGGTGRGGAITREDVRAAAGDGRPERGDVDKRLRRAGERLHATPRARALAADAGIDLTDLSPSRADGLITAADVQTAPPSAVEPLDRAATMRQAITRSMTRSKREIPHYYLATHIDLADSIAWLEARNDALSIGRRILPATLLLKATALALREVPELNGHWIDDRFLAADAVHLGVAVSLREGGLVAPAIHNADALDLDELMAALRDLVTRARAWRLRSSEMSDPTATVTNLGDRGVETGFPIIIPPQVAMVGFGKVTDSVVAVEGVPTVRPMVHATLSADHRVTDGHTGGLFLATIERLLQTPEDL